MIGRNQKLCIYKCDAIHLSNILLDSLVWTINKDNGTLVFDQSALTRLCIPTSVQFLKTSGEFNVRIIKVIMSHGVMLPVYINSWELVKYTFCFAEHVFIKVRRTFIIK